MTDNILNEPYQVLELVELHHDVKDVTTDEIKAAAERLKKRFDPATNPDDRTRERHAEVVEAASILLEHREAYDNGGFAAVSAVRQQGPQAVYQIPRQPTPPAQATQQPHGVRTVHVDVHPLVYRVLTAAEAAAGYIPPTPRPEPVIEEYVMPEAMPLAASQRPEPQINPFARGGKPRIFT